MLTAWLRFERLNLDYQRMGVARSRMPREYTTNEVPHGVCEVGWRPAKLDDIRLGILRLADAAHCIADQLHHLGDMRGAVRATVLLDYLHQTHPSSFSDDPTWTTRVPGELSGHVVDRLSTSGDPKDKYSGLDSVQKSFDDLELVAAAIAACEAERRRPSG